jgi:hypothetical protein
MVGMKRSHSNSQACDDAKIHLTKAAKALIKLMEFDVVYEYCPLEAQAAIESAAKSIEAALSCLNADGQEIEIRKSDPASSLCLPTAQQGQFLAYIHEYMKSNYGNVAPTHAALQKFFNLTPPSVNSMLKRLEKRGFISRIPGRARGIRLIISPENIPPLERPFKV